MYALKRDGLYFSFYENKYRELNADCLCNRSAALHELAITDKAEVVEIMGVEKPTKVIDFDCVMGHELAAQLLTMPNLPIRIGIDSQEGAWEIMSVVEQEMVIGSTTKIEPVILIQMY